METVMLGLCRDFQCLAGECPSTCCAGWKISVSAKDYGRFMQIGPQWLQEDILANICQDEKGTYYFRNCENGACAMLDGDGLCRIQRNAQEKSLCNTCRKYPRIWNKIDGIFYLSMAASCPVVAHALVCGSVFWERSRGNPGHTGTVWETEKGGVGRIPFIAREWDLYQENQELSCGYLGRKADGRLLYSCFEKMADAVLDIALGRGQRFLLLPFLQVFGRDAFHVMPDFLEESASVWRKLAANYMQYRLLSWKIEYPGAKAGECARQVQGELLLLRTLAFGAFTEKGKLGDGVWERLLCVTYRFCVHGDSISKEVSGLFSSFFSNDCIWNYVLL